MSHEEEQQHTVEVPTTKQVQRQRQEVRLRNYGIEREHEEHVPSVSNSLDAEVAYSDFPVLHAHHAG